MKSKKFSFSGTGVKLIRSFVLTILGAACVWFLGNYETIEILGQYPAIGTILPFIVNAVVKWTKEQH